jgi:anti-sigma factor RsiW
MNREFNDELLSAYLDGQLSAAESAAVESQLAASPQSRQLLDELRSISQQIRDLPGIQADANFTDRVVRAAIAAKAQNNGQVQLAPAAANQTSNKARRGARLPVVLAGVAAVAAAVALLLWGPWLGGSGSPGPAPGGLTNVIVQPPVATAAEAALAQLRQAIPQEGEAVVIRLRLAPGESAEEALNRAFTAAGIGSRLSSDPTSGATQFGHAYRQQLAAKFGGEQPGVPNTALVEGTIATADAVFVEASWETFEKAVAALAATPDKPLELCPLAHIAAKLPTPEEIAEMIANGEAPANTAGSLPANFAQRLPVSAFRLDKAAEQLAAAAAPAAIDGQRKVRILLLVEQAK